MTWEKLEKLDENSFKSVFGALTRGNKELYKLHDPGRLEGLKKNLGVNEISLKELLIFDAMNFVISSQIKDQDTIKKIGAYRVNYYDTLIEQNMPGDKLSQERTKEQLRIEIDLQKLIYSRYCKCSFYLACQKLNQTLKKTDNGELKTIGKHVLEDIRKIKQGCDKPQDIALLTTYLNRTRQAIESPIPENIDKCRQESKKVKAIINTQKHKKAWRNKLGIALGGLLIATAVTTIAVLTGGLSFPALGITTAIVGSATSTTIGTIGTGAVLGGFWGFLSAKWGRGQLDERNQLESSMTKLSVALEKNKGEPKTEAEITNDIGFASTTKMMPTLGKTGNSTQKYPKRKPEVSDIHPLPPQQHQEEEPINFDLNFTDQEIQNMGYRLGF